MNLNQMQQRGLENFNRNNQSKAWALEQVSFWQEFIKRSITKKAKVNASRWVKIYSDLSK